MLAKQYRPADPSRRESASSAKRHIAWRDAKIQKIKFELARLNR